MAQCRLLLVIVYTRIIVCKSCDSFYVSKWKGTGPTYRQIEASTIASKSLHSCTRWCVEKPSCILLSWGPGSCWQVGFCGTRNVTEMVFDPKKIPLVSMSNTSSICGSCGIFYSGPALNGQWDLCIIYQPASLFVFYKCQISIWFVNNSIQCIKLMFSQWYLQWQW